MWGFRHLTRSAATAILASGLALMIRAQAPAQVERPDLAELRAAVSDPAIPAVERGRRALDGAAALDRAAQQSGTSADRRARWTEAIALLDDFVARNPDLESAPLIRFQAAVYRWAEGQSLAEQAELTPSDAKARADAIAALDDSIRRFRAIAIGPAESKEPFGQNYRFRLARAIADRSRFEPEGDPARMASEREALGLLDAALTAPGLREFARLLRSELATRLGLFGQAQMELEEAEKLSPPPPPSALLEARVAALIGRRQYDEARRVIDAANVADPVKGLSTLRVTLARRREIPPGRERKEADDEAFRDAAKFQGASTPEGRRALMELARAVDEPGGDAPPEWWELLAEGHLRLGNPTRAGRLVARAADRAEAAGRPDRSGPLRFKAGAYLFEAGKFAEADRSLSAVLSDTKATRELKSRAGMLRALARGRAVATREPGASKAAYLDALEGQVRDFPAEPSTGEARWLLGQVRMSADRPEEAMALWSGIPHGHLRWTDARNLIADRLREAVEVQRINRDSRAIASKMDRARKSLRDALDAASDGPEMAALLLQLARLELIPDVGRPSEALDACDRLLKQAAGPEQHRLARLYRMVALAQANRSTEADKIARDEARSTDPADILGALRLLDRSASEADSETIRRRLSLIARVLSTRIVEHLDRLPVASRDEARLHHARALLFSGDPAGAKREIADWGGPVEGADDDLLRELADTYQRLDAFDLAIDAERYRGSRLAPGSLPWFESRYGMALAYYRADRLKEARNVIERTSILHPELGGGVLRGKFEKLRQRIGRD